MRTIKELLKKLGNANSSSLKSRLAQVLLYQRSVPHSLTQIAPSVALNNRKYVNARDRIHPSYNYNAIKKTPIKQIAQFEVGESVLAINMSRGPKWLKGSVLEKLGSNFYSVFINELEVAWKRHASQLSKIISDPSNNIDNRESIEFQPTSSEPNRDVNKRTRKAPVRYGYNQCIYLISLRKSKGGGVLYP